MSVRPPEAAGPDFLCIGLQKAGTRTLQQILSLDDRYWMPLVKEFHHFDGSEIPKRHERQQKLYDALQAGGIRLSLLNARRTREGLRKVDDRDLQFLKKSRSYLENGCCDADYLDMFSLKPKGAITGDITPGYSRLERTDVQRVHSLLPHAKIVLLLRDPISRAWSAINMRLRRETRGNLIRIRSQQQARMEELLKSSRGQKIVDQETITPPLNSQPSEIYRVWRDIYGEDAIRVFSLEEIISSPKGISEEIHATVTGEQGSGSKWSMEHRLDKDKNLIPSPNEKGGTAQVSLQGEIKARLIEAYADEIQKSAAMFGERATGWAAKYGL
ncbi:sulfotransferase [Ruegeria arenilitoris]|uniref:sulfotransferase n=1 Tax=Ruegeria arenilitoris TaxID=1173585 RepID=UPI00147D903A|nr:sulfotransferase [Ruegeria arenilitoris]